MLTRSLYLSMASVAGGSTGFYLLVSTVPQYVAAGGAGGQGAGLATGTLMLSTVAMELAVPYLLSKYGYRTVTWLGLLLLGAPAFALPLSSGLPLVLAVCLLRGAGLGILVVVGTALAADLSLPEDRSRALGAYGVAVGIPSIIGLPLGLWASGGLDYAPVFLIAGVIPLLSMLGLVAVPVTRPPLTRVERSRVERSRPGGLATPAMIFGAVALAAGVVVTFLPLTGHAGNASLALLAQSATTPLARWWAGRAASRYRPRRLLLPALLASALGIFLLVPFDGLIPTVAGMILFGTGFGIAQNVTLTVMFERVPRERFGWASMLWNLAFDGGMGIGATGFGLLTERTGYPLGFAAVAVLLLLTIPVARRDLRPAAPDSTDRADDSDLIKIDG
ncbi:MFS transporter [Planotetraspora phitsanulokensis]|uniref:MFS transporter n=1 Tax=Planotetraspora phitsanulokensis TaxID=575192 RepID=UPI00194FAA67|nr:MFS transporter [Planotetraspora phitsanulokensis]